MNWQRNKQIFTIVSESAKSIFKSIQKRLIDFDENFQIFSQCREHSTRFLMAITVGKKLMLSSLFCYVITKLDASSNTKEIRN